MTPNITGRMAGGALGLAMLLGLAPGLDGYAQTAGAGFTRPATDAAEIEMALGALPESMRATAAVYVLGPKGYRKATEGTSGVSCLVERSRPDTQEPICWDREGSETIMPVVMDRAVWQAEGVGADEIERRVQQRFADGTYRAPRRPGVSYMLSAHNYVFNGEQVIRFSPHVMFYAPYMTNADIGSDGTDPMA
jgi:hypothetical protein